MGAGGTSGHEGFEQWALLDQVLATPAWTDVRDLAVRHPVLLTAPAWQELDRRATAARDAGNEGLAFEIELTRDTLMAWSRLTAAELRTAEVEQPVPEEVKAAVELRERFSSTADPADAASAARAWLDVVNSPGFDSQPMGARTGYLFECVHACRVAYGVTSSPELLDALLATINRLINTPILPTTVPGALALWGQALALQYWAYDDPADARKALAVFRKAYEKAPRGSVESAMHLAHYAQWLRACSVAARKHLAPLEGVDWEGLLAQATDVLRAELPAAPAATVGTLYYELALCLEAQGEDSDPAALEEALDLARRAEASHMDLPPDRLGIRTLLARLAGQLHELTGQGDSEEITKQFREATSEAAALSSETTVRMAGSWGRWALRQRRPIDAVEALEAGIRAGDEIIGHQVSWQDREIWLGYRQSLTADLALALVMTGQPERAVEVLDSGRRGWLTEGLRAAKDAQLKLAGVPPELIGRLDQARADLRAALFASTGSDPDARGTLAQTRGTVRSARAALAAAEAEIREVLPDYGRPRSYAQIAETVTAQPLVYLAAAETSGLVLLIDPRTKTLSWELPSQLRSEALLGPLATYLGPTGSPGISSGNGAAGRPAAEWRSVLEATADWLGETLMPTLLRITEGMTAMLVISIGHLALLPLHLARRADSSAPTGYRYLIDDRSIATLPSAAYMPADATDDSRVGTAVPAAVIEAWDPFLPGARKEAPLVTRWFGQQARSVPPQAATRGSVLAAMREASVVHVACHGLADPLNPLDSALLLGPAERVTVRDLLADPGFTPGLVVLSACQSAMSGVRLPDEAMSLPAALLIAGAAAAIGSLWAVPDAPTTLLMARFYQLWQQEGHDPPGALRLAQIWLRDATNAEHASHFPLVDGRRARLLPDAVQEWESRRGYAHPDCWGGFVLAGGCWESGRS
jgi:CHAT domain-containing protein/tetratricopeptide (TPR) repeat protein